MKNFFKHHFISLPLLLIFIVMAIIAGEWGLIALGAVVFALPAFILECMWFTKDHIRMMKWTKETDPEIMRREFHEFHRKHKFTRF